MGYNIIYCIKCGKTETLQILNESFNITDSDFEYFAGTLRVELTLLEKDLIIELDNEIAFLWTTWRFSDLMRSDEVNTAVIYWEQQIKRSFENYTMLRLDEILLEEWNGKHGDDWGNRQDVTKAFFAWIALQDSHHWKLL